jgi:hypothetical protein
LDFHGKMERPHELVFYLLYYSGEITTWLKHFFCTNTVSLAFWQFPTTTGTTCRPSLIVIVVLGLLLIKLQFYRDLARNRSTSNEAYRSNSGWTIEQSKVHPI